jgi:hypothetical protein
VEGDANRPESKGHLVEATPFSKYTLRLEKLSLLLVMIVVNMRKVFILYHKKYVILQSFLVTS